MFFYNFFAIYDVPAFTLRAFYCTTKPTSLASKHDMESYTRSHVPPTLYRIDYPSSRTTIIPNWLQGYNYLENLGRNWFATRFQTIYRKTFHIGLPRSSTSNISILRSRVCRRLGCKESWLSHHSKGMCRTLYIIDTDR